MLFSAIATHTIANMSIACGAFAPVITWVVSDSRASCFYTLTVISKIHNYSCCLQLAKCHVIFYFALMNKQSCHMWQISTI